MPSRLFSKMPRKQQIAIILKWRKKQNKRKAIKTAYVESPNKHLRIGKSNTFKPWGDIDAFAEKNNPRSLYSPEVFPKGKKNIYGYKKHESANYSWPFNPLQVGTKKFAKRNFKRDELVGGSPERKRMQKNVGKTSLYRVKVDTSKMFTNKGLPISDQGLQSPKVLRIGDQPVNKEYIKYLRKKEVFHKIFRKGKPNIHASHEDFMIMSFDPLVEKVIKTRTGYPYIPEYYDKGSTAYNIWDAKAVKSITKLKKKRSK